MKTFIKILVASVLAMALFTTSVEAQNKKSAEVTFLTSIDCPNCAKKLEAKLPFEKGVKDLKIDVAKKTVWFMYNPKKTTKEKLAAAIVKLGFTAVEKKEEAIK